jgi:hypothetical protein
MIAAIHSALHYIACHRVGFTIAAFLLAIALTLEVWWILKKSPRDLTGNGIAIGQAKAFDSSSLTLRLQRLNAGLEALKVVNQNITENLSTVQERTSTASSSALSLKASPDSKDKDNKASDGKKDAENKTAADDKSSIGLGAGDALANQLNLASQIFNLQTLYEGSLSDRMILNESRLQTVLGFQVSISPPVRYEDCVAIVEMSVRTRQVAAIADNPAMTEQPVSLVALMPQEKTYNAEATTSVERSLDSAAAAKVFSFGVGSRRASTGAFIRRDPETVAFERKPGTSPTLLDNATTFGWEFRPELGRRAVSPGPRQLMAVIAVPASDAEHSGEIALEIRTRSYWRSYNRKRQTSGPAWSWLPWRVDRSGEFTSSIQELTIPNTAKIQETLAAKVSEIDWSMTGGGKAYVKVTGRNFFPGTRVLIGGQTKQEKDGTLTLKSEQVLEFEAPLESLVMGDAVLIGRYGKSVGLEDMRLRPVRSLNIWSASIRPMRNAKVLRLTVDIFGQDVNGNGQQFSIAHLSGLPDPILCVGNEAVPAPYDFSEQDILPREPTFTPPRILRVEAWISASSLAKSREVSFRIPFCGLDYYINQPMAYSEPTVTRMGSDALNTVFRVYFPQVFAANQTGISVDLDQTYIPGMPQLLATGTTTTGASEYRFTVPTELISRYQNMVVGVGKGEPYVIPIPQEEKPPVKALIDTSAAPAKVNKGKRGPVEWQGTGLDTIRTITFTPAAAPPAAITDGSTPAPATTPSAIPQDFAVYSDGTRLIVYLSDTVTAQAGKFALDCTTASGSTFKIPLFVLE